MWKSIMNVAWTVDAWMGKQRWLAPHTHTKFAFAYNDMPCSIKTWKMTLLFWYFDVRRQIFQSISIYIMPVQQTARTCFPFPFDIRNSVKMNCKLRVGACLLEIWYNSKQMLPGKSFIPMFSFDALEFNLCDWKFICKGFKRYSFPSEHSSLWVTNGFTLISA